MRLNWPEEIQWPFVTERCLGNVDENPRTSAQFDIRSIPTFLIFKNGKLVDQIIGAEPKQAIAQRLAAQL